MSWNHTCSTVVFPSANMKRLQPNDLCRNFKMILAFGSFCTILVFVGLRDTSDGVTEEQRSVPKTRQGDLAFEARSSSRIDLGVGINDNNTSYVGLLTGGNYTQIRKQYSMSPKERVINSPVTVAARNTVTTNLKHYRSNMAVGSTLNTVVVFSVPPKCGSRTLLLVVNALKEDKNDSFGEIRTLVDFKIVEKGSIQQKINYINRAITETRLPAFLYTHAFYMPYGHDETGHGTDRVVIRISIIRDPFERKLSHYYYSRFRDSEPETKEELVWRNSMKSIRQESYDDCVRLRRSECVAELFSVRLITQFCGYERGCRKANRFALERAKENVRNRFLIVGIMEEYEDFIRLLEKLLPDMFAGSIDKYKRIMESERESSMKTTHKIKPNNSTIAKVKNMMKFDYELYHFIKERFHEQKKMYL